MVNSSRTPEGDSNRCPLCGHPVRLEPSWPTRDAPCPHCGHLLWFAVSSDTARYDPHSAVFRLVEMKFGPVPEELRPAVTAFAERAARESAVLKKVLTATSLAEMLQANE